MKPFDPRLLRLVPATRGPVAALGVVGILQGIATIAVAFVLTRVVVEVVDSGSVTAADLTVVAAWLIGLFTVRALLSAAAESIQAWAGVRVASALRTRLIDHWLRTPVDTHPAPAAASTLAAQGCTSVEPYASRFLPSLIHAAVVPVLAIGAILVVDWTSAVIVILTVPLLPVRRSSATRPPGPPVAAGALGRSPAFRRHAGSADARRLWPGEKQVGRSARSASGTAGRRCGPCGSRSESAALQLLASISVVVAVWCVRLAQGRMELTRPPRDPPRTGRTDNHRRAGF